MKLFYAMLAVLAVSWTITACGGQHAGAQPVYQTPYGPSAHSPSFGKPPLNESAPPPASLTNTLQMYDSVSINVLPVGNPVYAGYTSGNWPTYTSLVAKFPLAKVVSIAVNTSHTAQCLDIEPGDATPSEAAAWFRADRSGHAKPCFYASLANWPTVAADLSAAGISRSQYFAWDANWTYVKHLDSGYDATQWTDHYNGTNVDASTVTKSFAGVTVAPHPNVPVPSPRTCPAKAKAIAKVCLKWFANTRFGKLRINERNAATVYKYHRAKSINSHLVYLRNRVWYVAHHNAKGGKLAKPNWNFHRGWRYQRLARDAAGK